jgi:hypothetical protein
MRVAMHLKSFTRFEEEILPKYFHRELSRIYEYIILIELHSNLIFFIDANLNDVKRQLLLYGFRFVQKGDDKEYFDLNAVFIMRKLDYAILVSQL